MYEYHFETVTFGLLGRPDKDYQALSNELGAQGWRLVHLVHASEQMRMEFVFERASRGPQDAMRADGPEELPSYQAPPQLNRG